MPTRQRMSTHVKTKMFRPCQNMPKHANTCHDCHGLVCFGMLWYVLVCSGMFWHVLVCSGMFWYVLIRHKTCQHVPKHDNADVFWYVLLWLGNISTWLGLESTVFAKPVFGALGDGAPETPTPAKHSMFFL